MSKGNTLRLGRIGDPCPRCGQLTEVREHRSVTAKLLRQPFYYSRWFYCTNPSCRTTLIMPEHFRVYPAQPEPRPQQFDDIVLSVLNEQATHDDRPPWD
jgi:hypothetical protein